MALTTAQREHLERRLLEERERIVSALGRYALETHGTVRDESGDISVARFHIADMGSDSAHQEFDAANAARQTSEFEEIDAALQRLYQQPDDYGRCERAGDPIPFERLEAVPWARTCRAHSD
ncbi:MAG TPA: TraR/DksA C4-type zinc finger protein [Gemmatimonadales bacterium]|nr:TraR/DksA C4-type zinc finger protein [Gemmatimonadales bacterium]